MLSGNQCFQVRGEEIAAKVIDGEAIIINLANGIYYSMDRVGGLVWETVQAGHTFDDITKAVRAYYAVSTEQAQRDVEQLVQELLQENLISFSDAAAADVTEKFLGPREQLAYEVPKLNIYRDMGDLLALDPPTPGLSVNPWKESAEKSLAKGEE